MNHRDLLKKVFHFHPGLIIGTTLPLGFGMAFVNRFPEAYLLFSVCLVCAAGLWLTSDSLLKAKAKSEKLPAKRNRFSQEEIARIMRHKKNRHRLRKWGGCTAIAALGIVCFATTARWNYEWELEQTFGVLTPADDPTPEPMSCLGSLQQPSPSAIRVYAGGGLFWSDGKTLTLVRIHDKPMLSGTLIKESLVISGDIYTPDGDLVHIDQNHFETQSDLGFKPKRPDRHTLKVLDRWHREVLDIRFLNPRAIKLSGIFWSPGEKFPVVLDDDGMRIGGNTWSAPCFGGSGTMVNLK